MIVFLYLLTYKVTASASALRNPQGWQKPPLNAVPI